MSEAIVFDGCIVSGWPIPDQDGEGELTWEADGDVGRSVEFAGVTHWIEFPERLSTIWKAST